MKLMSDELKSQSEDQSKDQYGLPIRKNPWTDKAILFGVIIIVFFIGGFSLWAVVAPLESAAIAPGKVIVAGYHRSVQHLEGGIVKAIYVKDGSAVKKGQVLIKMDDTRDKIALQLRQNEVFELSAIASRLIAERDDKNKITFSARLQSQQHNAKIQEIIKSQTDIFKANEAAHKNNLTIVEQKIKQLNQEIKGTESLLASIKRQLSLIQEEVKTTTYLEKQKLIERSKLLALQRSEADLKGKRGESVAKIASLKQKIGEAQLQKAAFEKERSKEINKELRESQQKLAEAVEKEKAAQDVLDRTSIVAPQTGTVVGLKVHTIGGIIKPGEVIMDVVPSQEQLVVEARVNPSDIDVVHKGLKAKIQLTAFKTRTTPTLLGTVTKVSADIFTNEATGETYYLVRIVIPKKELMRMPEDQKLYPGMPAQAMIVTAKLTPWQYFATPILESFQRAFKEQ